MLKKLILLFFIVLFLPLQVLAKETINIAFTIDKNFPAYTLLVINSILLNNSSKSDYMFYIVENDLTEKDKAKMRKYIERRGQKIQFINVDTAVIDNNENFYQNEHTGSAHVTRIGTARILLGKLLPENIHKVIYLDSDILVLSDIKELWDYDISKYAAGMAENVTTTGKKVMYYNSGVILMNLDYWRKYNLAEKITKYLNDNRNLEFPDQDAINAVLAGKILGLPVGWNETGSYFRTSDDISWVKIVHYISNCKPWLFKYHNLKSKHIYYKYWFKSGLYLEYFKDLGKALYEWYDLFCRKEQGFLYFKICYLKTKYLK